jgi:hypothetical protein
MTRWNPARRLGSRCCTRWREVEVEFGACRQEGGSETRARKLLEDAGASPSTSRTKLDRALTPTSGDGGASTVEPGTVGELVACLPGSAVRWCSPATMSECVPVRQTVHQTRVAARRMRSTLRTRLTMSLPLPSRES